MNTKLFVSFIYPLTITVYFCLIRFNSFKQKKFIRFIVPLQRPLLGLATQNCIFPFPTMLAHKFGSLVGWNKSFERHQLQSKTPTHCTNTFEFVLHFPTPTICPLWSVNAWRLYYTQNIPLNICICSRTSDIITVLYFCCCYALSLRNTKVRRIIYITRRPTNICEIH